jgi:hypothetical protein
MVSHEKRIDKDRPSFAGWKSDRNSIALVMKKMKGEIPTCVPGSAE